MKQITALILFPALLLTVLLAAGCSRVSGKKTEPVSGKYCVVGTETGKTFPERTALKFDFETGNFNFGTPESLSSWLRAGTLSVEGSRITAVSTREKYDTDKDPIEPVGNYTWIFEIGEDGSLTFVPEGSDEFAVYGTTLTEGSVLVRVGDLDKPIEFD